MIKKDGFIEVSLEKAYEHIKNHTVSVTESETVSVFKCYGRVLAEDIVAEFDGPAFDRSPYDGYAVRSQDIAGASPETPVVLKVVDEVCAGMIANVPADEGQAVRIMTGAPVPEGADCVVMQEDTDYGEESVRIYKALGHHENYSFSGENFRKGQKIISAGTRLSYTDAGVLSALGLDRVKVFRRPKAAVIATGDEIVMPGETLPPAKIYNSNMYMLAAAAEVCGAVVISAEMSGDDLEVIGGMIAEVSEEADVIITSGGISVGKKDLLRKALSDAGAEILFSRVDVRPGGAVTFADMSGTAVVCLSGSPYSAASSFEISGRLALQIAGGEDVTFETFKDYCQSFTGKHVKRGHVRNVCNGGQVVRF